MTHGLQIAPLRPADDVMRLSRLGAAHPTRLSFMRSLIRRLSRERAQVRRTLWDMSPEGYGRAVYTVRLSGRAYSLVAVSSELPPEARSDRVIATAWDAAFVLYDGEPSADEVDRIARAAPRQEAARFTARELVLSRANKSVRMFEHVAGALAAGRQPAPELLARVGYLMRTTAVYGNGKFGIADRADFQERPELAGSFQAEMLLVWLVRGFTLDLVEHVAEHRNPGGAAGLSRDARRRLGVGNATGLGMAPFLVTHPELLHVWISARETALARVRAQRTASPERRDRHEALFERARAHVNDWVVDDAAQAGRIETLRRELAAPRPLAAVYPWDALITASASGSLEFQELMVSLVLESHGDLIDDLAESLTSDETPRLDPRMSVEAARAALRRHCGWALNVDFADPRERAVFWYVSQEKLEPRLGRRDEEPGADRETPLDVALRLQAFSKDLARAPGAETIGAFLRRHPEHTDAARRLQRLMRAPYAEIRDNLLAEGMRPIDILRCKLALFGASKFDPKSDLWTRITMFQGAPGFDDVLEPDADDWWAPAWPAATQTVRAGAA